MIIVYAELYQIVNVIFSGSRCRFYAHARATGRGLREKWAELKLQTKMATLCGVRRLFSSSSRAVRLAAAPVGPRGTWRRSCRELSTSSAWRAGVDPAEESVFGQDHVEMREVRSVATPSLPYFYWFKVSVHSHLTLSLSLVLQALNKFIEREINPFVDEWENARGFPSHEVDTQ